MTLNEYIAKYVTLVNAILREPIETTHTGRIKTSDNMLALCDMCEAHPDWCHAVDNTLEEWRGASAAEMLASEKFVDDVNSWLYTIKRERANEVAL